MSGVRPRGPDGRRTSSSPYAARHGAVEVLPYETGLAVYRADDVEYPDTSVAPEVHGQTEGMSRSLIRHFAGVVRNLWKPQITPRDGQAVVRVASAVDASLKEGREIILSPTEDA